MRVGLLGGTFDPIHIGHLLLANVVLEECTLDTILFIPCNVSPLKPVMPVASSVDRLVMVEMAVQSHPAFRVSDVEIQRGGISYTLDTLGVLRHRGEWREAEFFLILGMDAFLDFRHWKSPEAIVQHCRLIVMRRPGYSCAEAEMPFQEHALFLSTPLIGISSTEIRNRIRQGKSIRYWVPDAVEKYILEKRLYQK